MTKSAKRIPAILLLCAFLIMFFPFRAHAAASGKMVYNDPTVTVGNNVTVTFTISADTPIAAFQAIITYDSSLLTYVSYSGSGLTANGGSGSISMNYAETSNLGTSISGSFTFQTLGTGTAEVKTTSISACDLDEVGISISQNYSDCYAKSTVKITAAPTASSEARLSSLSVGSGTLSPAFSSDVYEYSTTVGNDVSRLVVSASAKDSGASVSVSGQNLSVGANTVTVKVTAADGSVKTYTIHATRQAAEEPEEEEEPEVEPEEEEIPEEEPEEPEEAEESAAVVSVAMGENVLVVSESLDEVALPEDFVCTDYDFRGAEVEAAVSEIRPLVLLWLTDEDGENGAFYIYDEEQDDLYPMVELSRGTNRYIILRLYDPSVIPDGFAQTVAEIDDMEVTAWYAVLDGEDTPFLLLWAMNDAGETGLYRYDTEEGTIQRYIRETLAEPTQPEETEEPEETDAETDERLAELEEENAQLREELNQANEDQTRSKLTNRILIIVACAELLVFVLILIFTSARRKSGGDSGPDDDESGDYDPYDPYDSDDTSDFYDSYDSHDSKSRSSASAREAAGGGKRIKKD